LLNFVKKGYLINENVMKDKNSVSIIFWQRRDKINDIGTAPVYMRITVNGKREEISINKRFDVSKWKNGSPVGSSFDAKELKKDLDACKTKVNTIIRDLKSQNKQITAANIKEIYTGKGKNTVSVLEAFEAHNLSVRKLENIDYSHSTVKRYETTLEHIRAFIKYQYNRNDLLLTELNYKFIDELEIYFKTIRKCNHNSSVKYIKNFRKIVNKALKNEWLDKDPFSKYSIKLEEVKRVYLTTEELTRIKEKNISIARVRKIRDIFLFCCYTGLAFSDVKKLTQKDIIKNDQGELHISQQRTKIKKNANVAYIMLLPPALTILEKYKNDPECSAGNLLPVPSLDKYNAYLKEVADICGIEKNLTTHVARHTFATTVTLLQGVPMETVSKMLGHKSLRSTQIYSKVVEEKVTYDMNILKKKMLGINDQA